MHLSFSALAPIASHSSLLIHISPKLSKLQITEAPFQHTNLGFNPRGGGTIATWSDGIPFALSNGGSLPSALPKGRIGSAYLSEMNAPRPFRADVPPIKRMEVEAVLTLFSVPALAIAAAIAPSKGDLEASRTISKLTFDQSYAVASTIGATSGTGAAAGTGGLFICEKHFDSLFGFCFRFRFGFYLFLLFALGLGQDG